MASHLFLSYGTRLDRSATARPRQRSTVRGRASVPPCAHPRPACLHACAILTGRAGRARTPTNFYFALSKNGSLPDPHGDHAVGASIACAHTYTHTHTHTHTSTKHLRAPSQRYFPSYRIPDSSNEFSSGRHTIFGAEAHPPSLQLCDSPQTCITWHIMPWQRWQELDLVRQFERDGDKRGTPACVACVADSRSKVEKDPLIPVTTHSLPKQTFKEQQQQFLPFKLQWTRSAKGPKLGLV